MTDKVAQLYLDLLKRSLTCWGEDDFVPIELSGSLPKVAVKRALQSIASAAGLELGKTKKFDPHLRELGRDLPRKAITMIGMKRLNNLQYCVETIIRDNIPGDLIETGVWRGGATIFMRAALEAFGDQQRIVWCADSFKGLPAPDVEKYSQDKGAVWHTRPELAMGLPIVQANFARYGLLDDRVKFLVGWFKDTLPKAPISTLSILRLDGDMYESTMDALNAHYHKVSPRGFIIVDDYGIPQDACRRAIHDFRNAHKIKDEILDIDEWGVYWRKSQ